jgi:hypothetical protein
VAGVGAVAYGAVDALDSGCGCNHENKNRDGYWLGGGLVLVLVGDWLTHDANMNYYYPAAKSYNKYLLKYFDLGLYAERSGAGMQTVWRF